MQVLHWNNFILSFFQTNWLFSGSKWKYENEIDGFSNYTMHSSFLI